MKNKPLVSLAFGAALLFSCVPTNSTQTVSNVPLPVLSPTAQNIEIAATSTPSFFTGDLNMENLNAIPPKDIIEEIAFFVGGMGGEGCTDSKHKGPTIFPKIPQSIDLMDKIEISLCGVRPGEKVQMKIRHPQTDAIVMQETKTVSSIFGQNRGYVDFSEFFPSLDALTGEYQIIFTGSDWSLKYSIEVNQPETPYLWLVDDGLIIYGFQPNEIIKLLVYEEGPQGYHWKFIGWNQVQVDQQGYLQIHSNIKDASYVAFRNTYEFLPSIKPGENLRMIPKFSGATFYCEGAPHQEAIKPYSIARVAADYVDEDGRLIKKGEIVDIYAGPSCKENQLYWQIACHSDWSCFSTIPESGPDGFYLEHIDKQSLIPTVPSFTQVPKITNPVDNAQMITVPGGFFELGLDSSQYSALNISGSAKGLLNVSHPSHIANLNKFKIYVTEVSNSMYANCVTVGACKPPVKFSSQTRIKYYNDSKYAHYPVIFVTWEMAQEYCQWAGGRLPTEAEWEYAARGPQSLLFPWGNEARVEGYANLDGIISDTTPVSDYPIGASPFGLLNMTGNVWEWVQDWYRADYYSTNTNWDNPTGPQSGDNKDGELKVGKGGSFWTKMGNSSPALHDWYQADQADAAVGFRCVIVP